jgi:hypothetical protein
MEENLNANMLKEYFKTKNPQLKVRIEGYKNLIKISKEKNYKV